MNKLFNFLGELIDSATTTSSKNFSLVVAVIIGAIIGLCCCFVLIYDVISDGTIQTDLNDLGMLMLCVGGYIAGGGITKALGNKSTPTTTNKNEEPKEVSSPKKAGRDADRF